MEQKLSHYHNRVVCVSCDWFAKPTCIMGTTWWEGYPVNVCPDCGEPTKMVAGRLRFKTIQKGFGWFAHSEEVYLCFEQKEHESISAATTEIDHIDGDPTNNDISNLL